VCRSVKLATHRYRVSWLRMRGALRPGFESRLELGILLFAAVPRLTLGPTRPPTQWVLGALSPGVKLLGREADHSPPSSAEVKNAWSYIFTHPYFMAWCLIKNRYNFTFTLPFYVFMTWGLGTLYPFLSVLLRKHGCKLRKRRKCFLLVIYASACVTVVFHWHRLLCSSGILERLHANEYPVSVEKLSHLHVPNLTISVCAQIASS
jgi:hypothetical protein